MDCPKCKHNTLKPYKMADELPAMYCAACDGVLIALLNYRYWLENSGDDSHRDENIEVLAEDTDDAMLCPKCERLMTKYRVSEKTDHRLDLCAHCDEVWMDTGEWQMLKQLGIHNRLSTIFTEPWQSRIVKTETNQRLEKRLQEDWGEQDYRHVREFREWLLAHPQSSELRAYLLDWT